MTTVSTRLVAKRAGAQDEWLVEIGLTAKGVEALNVILPFATLVQDRLFAGLSAAPRATLDEVIERFHRGLEKDPDAKHIYEDTC